MSGWQNISGVPTPIYPEEYEVYDQKVVSVIFCFADGRVKEGFTKWQEDINSDNFKCNISYWLANDSCSCCYEAIDCIPTHWQPLPTPPETASS